MGRLDYEGLGWQEAIVLGSAKQEGILEAIADKDRSAVEVANQLGLSLRAVDTLLSALVELGVLVQRRETASGCSKSTEDLSWTPAVQTTPEDWQRTGSS
jgi:predicted HTH transcriptional regulator